MLHYIALLYFLFIAMMHFCICRELRNHTSVHFSQHVCSIKAASRLNNSGMESSCLHLKVDALVDSAHPQWSTVMPTIMLWKHYQYAIDVSFHPRVPLIIISLLLRNFKISISPVCGVIRVFRQEGVGPSLYHQLLLQTSSTTACCTFENIWYTLMIYLHTTSVHTNATSF